jgi:hypothetical protein
MLYYVVVYRHWFGYEVLLWSDCIVWNQSMWCCTLLISSVFFFSVNKFSYKVVALFGISGCNVVQLFSSLFFFIYLFYGFFYFCISMSGPVRSQFAWHGRLSPCGQWPTSSETHHHPGSISTSSGCSLGLNVSPYTTSSMLWQFPLCPLPWGLPNASTQTVSPLRYDP